MTFHLLDNRVSVDYYCFCNRDSNSGYVAVWLPRVDIAPCWRKRFKSTVLGEDIYGSVPGRLWLCLPAWLDLSRGGGGLSSRHGRSTQSLYMTSVSHNSTIMEAI